ncbi:hypothetical protein IC620_16535 [Hazenella sp. IB182357]|uniref:D-glucuronyl C5-epimerase C-terminal domain-containing protein n=1 Tax=Polycladospora coralii TaxID=2771432 RepID=A0A926RYY7_9BACL|nr:D-glucuronyl C5-epimerase family protein [Polycladospora coralii]MBD1373951.1 hypothetical protein [Polycladospora coralii]
MIAPSFCYIYCSLCTFFRKMALPILLISKTVFSGCAMRCEGVLGKTTLLDDMNPCSAKNNIKNEVQYLSRKIFIVLFSFFFVSTLFLGVLITYSSMSIVKVSKPHLNDIHIDVQSNVKYHEFYIQDIFPKNDFYAIKSPVALIDEDYNYDSEGYIVYEHPNGKKYYSPYLLTQQTIKYLGSYNLTQDRLYLEKAKEYTDKLFELAEKKDNKMHFPHHYIFELHGLPSEKLDPVWYSIYAQGQALSVFSRMYQTTGDKKYLAWANQTFNGLDLDHDPRKNTTLSYLDLEGHLWFGYYPKKQNHKSTSALIRAVVGFYDYYQINQTKSASFMLNASITTFYEQIELYRVEGDISIEDLKHKNQDIGRHRLNILALKYLYRITNEVYFNDMANAFYSDYNFKKEKNSMYHLERYIRKEWLE